MNDELCESRRPEWLPVSYQGRAQAMLNVTQKV